MSKFSQSRLRHHLTLVGSTLLSIIATCLPSSTLQSSMAHAAPIPTPKPCTIEVANGLLQKCCVDDSKPYIPGVRICQNFAFDFHKLCVTAGLQCKTIGGGCGANYENAHRFNLVFIQAPAPGLWYIADPTNDTQVLTPGFADSTRIPEDLLCKAFGRTTNKGKCDCQIGTRSDLPLTPVTDQNGCAELYAKVYINSNGKFFSDWLAQCQDCCNAQGNDRKSNDPKWAEWTAGCKKACELKASQNPG